MKVKQIKYYSLLLFAITLTTLFSLPIKVMADSCSWDTVESINCNGSLYWLSTSDRVTSTGANLKPTTTDRYLFVPDSLIDTYRNGGSGPTSPIPYLEVLLENPLQGYFMGGPATSPTSNPVSISDPNNVAPDPLINLGPNMTINGTIKFITRDGSGSPINKKLITDELEVYITDQFGNVINLDGAGRSRSVTLLDSATNTYTWNQMTVLPEMFTDRKYTLRTNLPDDKYVDCVTGEDGGIKASEQCKLSYSGSVDFKVTKDRKIQIISNATKWEAEATGKAFPVIRSQLRDGFKIEVNEKLDSPLDKALSSTIKWLANLVETGLQVTMNWVDSLLNSTDEYVLGKGTPGNTGVEPAWTKIRNISLTLLVLALIVIAFANVYQVNIEQYGLNRMVPKIIIAIIMAYMSWVFVLFFFDLASVIQAQANSFLSSGSGISLMGSVSIQTPTSADILAKMGAILVLIILLFGAWVCGIVLLFLLLLRIVMLSFLLAVAPMAMIANIMPFTSNLYKKWWNEFFKWMFMGPIATAIIALGTIIATNTGFGTNTNKFDESVVSNASTPGSGVNLLVGILILAASMYMAATLPLKWGGNIMGRWAGAGKKLWGNTGGKILGGAGSLASMGANKAWQRTGVPGTWNKYWSAKGKSFDTKVAEKVGRNLESAPGLNDTEKHNARRELEGIYSAQFGNSDAHNLHDEYAKAKAENNQTKMRSIMKLAKQNFSDNSFLYAEKGQFNENGSYLEQDKAKRKDQGLAAKARAASDTQLLEAMNNDRQFRNHILSDDPGLAMEIAWAQQDATILRDLSSGNSGKPIKDSNKGFIEGLAGEARSGTENNPSTIKGSRLQSILSKQAAGEEISAFEQEWLKTAQSEQERIEKVPQSEHKKIDSSLSEKQKGAYDMLATGLYGPGSQRPTAPIGEASPEPQPTHAPTDDDYSI